MNRTVLLTLPALLALASCNRGGGEIEGVQSFQNKGGAHQEGRITYAQTPPAGGPHNPAWQNCGVYDRPLYDEYAVHSLEHGAVWLSYQPGLPADQVGALKTLVEGRSYTLLSPHESQKAPLVLTAWNRQLVVQDVSDPRVKQFLQTYEQGGEAPEIGASCSGAYNGTV
ncbi:hypothetical protein DAERI_020192 [Deinococcus aerius]|uniref:DUF3105 domain-containing protein n=2 Tax=Deinococcus TaxID=1298 RepID=A0A2I9DVS4_9DEIO|nr:MULTISPECIES: DUF3105 domain-containing protein [Deinococcus]MBB5293947.1 hypothetical protein [Deinococcus metallilatus]QBY07479.1 DUF3105 domain-containing protein [Deinococcus metallilatus]RXJ14592.1 DUF3105 domain-containing protein [Deinococcus metallilatus]TLK30712.1 DUF3105 domain-containing protein [Deinococcus metallilatus]GBF04595.1 hypothetical protein DAERI_020192 [Deinococcus aerius]